MQGVGFRYFTLYAARREGLHGYVSNRDDGTVEAVAEGEAEALDRLSARCGEGRRGRASSASHVDEAVPTGLHAGFKSVEKRRGTRLDKDSWNI